MPIFKEMIKRENSLYHIKKRTIWINDMAYIHYRWWAKQKKKGNNINSRTKTNSEILKFGDLKFNRDDSVSAGVVGNRLGGFSSSGIVMRIIGYKAPETGENDLLHYFR